MERYYLVAIVTFISGLVVFGMALTVSRTQAKTGILAPAMTGNPRLERAYRAHLNTVEWTPVFLPSMWLFCDLLEPVMGRCARRTLVDRPDRLLPRLSVGRQEAFAGIFHSINSDFRTSFGRAWIVYRTATGNT